ncbi:hypothetical protein LJK88_04535 [Paenibacillus sp. P26]|nr:hypothetical protein LJK88_04535 [Paenibacillus sp. P26]UUZ90664.1 hypothetical protein LJK87_32980 [Paenibacillus sp. P25]
MILYQLAKRLERRNQLQQTIERTDGDVRDLLMQKEQVEEQLQTQANAWTEEGQDEFLLASVPVDNELNDNSYL